jgi:Holliday junction resolvase
MKEQQIQAKRIKQLEAEGYYVLKLIRVNKTGIPDLIAIKEGEILFSEIKTPRGKLSEMQKYRIKELESYGFKTEVYNGE